MTKEETKIIEELSKKLNVQIGELLKNPNLKQLIEEHKKNNVKILNE